MKSIVEYDVKSIKIRLYMDPKVYMPSAATLLIAQNLGSVKDMKVLDLGTGSGFLAILASKLGAKKVVATDISPRALRRARENATLNGVENIEFRHGDLYGPVEGEHFDLIICNPPMTPSKNPIPRFTWGGVNGRVALDRVIVGAPRHLREDGKLIVPVISLVGISDAAILMRRVGLKPRVLDYCVHPFGKRLLKLIDYLKKLPSAEYVFDGACRPCWRLVLFEAVKC